MRNIWITGLLSLLATVVFGQHASSRFDQVRKQEADAHTYDYFLYSGLGSWRQQNDGLQLYPSLKPPKGCDNCLVTAPSCFKANYIIPVVVHVVHLPAHNTVGTGSNISVPQIENQMERLNRYFSNFSGTGAHAVNTGIQFCLAPVGPDNNGIIRYSSDSSNHHIESFDWFLGLNNTLPQDKYLHIFVCNDIITDPAVKGYSSTFGDQRQGVVIEYKRFGWYDGGNPDINVDATSEGKVLVHEVGHFLGLLHTFEGGCSGMSPSDCDDFGDRCCDVPPVATANLVCGSVNSCIETGDLPDQVENYMDYAGEACQNTFTQDQTEIMHYMLARKRTALVDPAHINSLNLGCCSFSAHFKPSSSSFCKNDSITFTALEYTSSVTYKWTISLGGTVVHSISQSSPILGIRLGTAGLYDVRLSVYQGSDSAWNMMNGAVLVQDCGTPLQSSQGNWYFGQKAGIRFMQNATVSSDAAYINNTVNSVEGALTQSAPDGRLLFYGAGEAEMDAFGNYINDSFYVYDKNHQLMPHGVLRGSSSSYQGGVIVPHPSNGKRFYLITTNFQSFVYNNTDDKGLRWSMVDTTLNGGAGDVVDTLRNIPVRVPVDTVSVHPVDSAVFTGEGIAAIPHCDGKRHWLVLTGGTSAYTMNRVLIFLVDTDGIYFQRSFLLPFGSDIVGTISASPDGSKVCVGDVLYNFCRKSGVMSLMKKFSGVPTFSEFSPNSKVLYLVTMEDTTGKVWQVDLEDGSLQPKLIPVEYSSRALQLGPDGKIYVAQINDGAIGVLDYPDQLNNQADPNAVGYRKSAINLNPNGTDMRSMQGLPNMIDARLEKDLTPEILASVVNCNTVRFSANICCSNLYRWYFGDGDSADTRWPEHVYNANGIYTVTLRTDSGYITRQIQVGISGNKPVIAGSRTLCDTSRRSNFSISNYKPDSFQYTWKVSNGVISGRNGQSSADISWKTANLSQHGQVTLVYRNRFGCADSVTIKVALLFKDSIADRCDSLIGIVPDTMAGLTMQWQRSTDGVNWTDIAGATGVNYDYPDTGLNYYYRRMVLSGTCSIPSNVIRAGGAVISRQPVSVRRKCNLHLHAPDTFKLSVYPRLQSRYSFQWQRRPVSGSWQNVTGKTDTGMVFLYFQLSDQDSVRCRVIDTECQDTIYTTVVTYSIPNPVFQILAQPRDTTINNNQTGRFRVLLNSNYPHNFRWQVSYDTIHWEYLPGYDNDTLLIPGAGRCQRNHYYRVEITNECGTVLYSRPAKLSVNGTSLPAYQPWMKDLWPDLGTEPHLAVYTNWNYARSPDIWISRNYTNTTRPPDTKLMGPRADDSNYVFVMVRNRGVGSHPAGASKLRLYWTWGANEELWPLRWTENPGNIFTDYLGREFYMGGEITNSPISIPFIAPGDSVLIRYYWDSVPQPINYYTVVNGVIDTFKNTMPTCVLARIEMCAEAPYGMTYPEVVRVDSNIGNNNKVSSRNMITRYLNNPPGTHLVVKDPVVIRNENSYLVTQSLCLTVNDPAFYVKAYAYVVLDDALYSAWSAGGKLGAGFVELPGHILQVNSSGFCLNNISAPPNMQAIVQLSFAYINPLIRFASNERFYLDFIQSDMERTRFVYGFVVAHEETATGDFRQQQGNNNQDLATATDLEVVNGMPQEMESSLDMLGKLYIYPNPAEHFVNVEYLLSDKANISLQLKDMYGRTVVSQLQDADQHSGQYKYALNCSDLAQGVYYLVFTRDGRSQTAKIVLIK